jgi:hypothetical protein
MEFPGMRHTLCSASKLLPASNHVVARCSQEISLRDDIIYVLRAFHGCSKVARECNAKPASEKVAVKRT